ncbi:hypothetical protein LCGC14_1635790 [marine sediment metagenome]|uniref:Uncharacterized protein n=1 Tax=marine sediment metagenome TaxID=412755 RepID=A0A0F9KIA6_9ZZZZ
MNKIKEKDLDKKGTASTADILKEAGKISNKDARFLSAYIADIRKDLLETALSIRIALGNIDSTIGTLDSLRIMIDRLHIDTSEIKKVNKLNISSSWDISIGSKLTQIFTKIERKVLTQLLGSDDDEEWKLKNDTAKELTKGIAEALKEQKELIIAENKLLKERMKKLRFEVSRMRGMNDAAKDIANKLGR